ncbi:hypothetical protein L3X38_035531 [Prunus dulcis]|uniref:Uncharacterized protein n=1 Tax=Prunus dulcis TaxID=3755 RepID=A0AAD4VLL7_PRUDU|nr:hypothetical protein L3X38_035531 [Prunus dulcis]
MVSCVYGGFWGGQHTNRRRRRPWCSHHEGSAGNLHEIFESVASKKFVHTNRRRRPWCSRSARNLHEISL